MQKNSSHVILFNENQQIFLIKRTDYPVWSITGGGIEGDEEPKSAAIREAKEESGFDIDISDLKIRYQFFKHGQPINKGGFLYKGSVKSGTYVPEFEGNIGKWFNLDKLPLSMTYNAKQMIRDLSKYDASQTVINLTLRESIWDNIRLVILNPIFFVRNYKKIANRMRG